MVFICDHDHYYPSPRSDICKNSDRPYFPVLHLISAPDAKLYFTFILKNIIELCRILAYNISRYLYIQGADKLAG